MAGESIWRRPAPTSLKLIAGAVIFPLLWLGIGLICGELLKGYVGSPIPPWLLIAAAIVGALASFLLARKASLRVAVILIALPMLAYVLSYFSLQNLGNADKTFGNVGEMAPPPAESEARPAPSEPSGGGPQNQTEAPSELPGAAPQYETEAPAKPEAAAPPPPAGGEGGTLGTTEDAEPPQAQSEQQAAEIAEQRAKEEEEKRQAEQEAAAQASQQPSRPPPQSQTAQLPEFPWPPPAASASYVLPDRLLASYHTVGDVVAAIIGALEQSGYVERSFFRTEAGGVALVTRLERINDDGTPSVAAERWPNSGDHYASRDSLFEFLERLFYVDPGHYRVIVFVLQDLPFSQSSTNVTAGEARAWLVTGANVLPPEIATRPFGGHCTALIYEFASDGTKVHVVESRLTGKEHLEKAGLLAALGTTH
jgi:hypothetical protein